MEYRQYGRTGIKVSVLGFGAGHIGQDTMSEEEAGTLLNRMVDRGVNLIDTARGYGLSEERIGRHLSWRRDDIVLSTKVGYGVDGVPDWTADCVRLGIERALGMMRTDRIEIVHLHSCPLETLKQGEVVEALLAARQSGKILAAAYSGDNEPLEYAAACGLFDGIETSLNICDQWVISHGLAAARSKALGVIAKRPLANGPWRYADRPAGQYVETYWERFRTMGLHEIETDWQEAALHFVAGTAGVSSCIAGTGNVGHAEANVRLMENGTLEPVLRTTIESAFAEHGAAWRGEV